MQLTYEVDGDDFVHAGEASASVKRTLKQLGIVASSERLLSPCTKRR